MVEFGRTRMSKDSLEGPVRSAVGQAEKIVGQAIGDEATTRRGVYDEAAGKVQAALGSAKDAVSQGVDAAVGAAGDSLSQSASIAQDRFATFESDVETRIKKYPWTAVAIAALIGLLIGKLS
jgi:uncharacterized protein YjbJ (UPF0337 family)